MNKEQKEVLQSQLNNEKRTIRELKQVYTQALKDCEAKIAELSSRRDMENLQSIIYQKQYQQALKGQLEGILEQLHSNEFATVSDYLARCYEDGYIGVMYDLQGQGIPLVMPIDQEQVARAIQTDSKLKKELYDSLGEDVNKLKRSIRAEVSRGIANGSTWNQIASKLAQSFKHTPFNTAYNRAITIARTEGHRIQVQAADHAQHKAKAKGANIVKQWDATLDGKTRDSHRQVDGEIKELDEKFSNGLMFPGDPSGSAAEVINCRCALLQRAKWALDDAELNTLKERAKYFGLDKTKDFEDFKKKYNKAVDNIEKSSKIIFKKATTIEEAKNYAKDVLEFTTIDYDKFNLDVANMVNREITEIYNVFGNIHKVGFLSGVRLYPKKTSWYAAYSPGWKEVFMKNVTAKNSLSKMAKEAQFQFESGFWSTGNAEHAVRHEVGHAIQHWLTDNDADKLGKITELKSNVMKACGITTWDLKDTKEHMKAAGEVISYYALRNEGEFIAESVAEYMAGNPREIAKKVVEILLEGSG